MNRHEQRVVAMQSVYQHLLLGKDIRKCVFDVMKGSNDIDGYLYSLTIGTVENKEAFEQKINELLRDDWDFDRLSMLEQAILLSISEKMEIYSCPSRLRSQALSGITMGGDSFSGSFPASKKRSASDSSCWQRSVPE